MKSPHAQPLPPFARLRAFLRRHAVVLSWAAVVLVCAAIFAMSAKSGQELDESSGIVSVVKAWLAQGAEALLGHPTDVSPIGHFSEYLLLGAVLENALRWHAPLKRCIVLAPLMASAYGITDELHQIFVPSRSCDPADWLVDTVAAVIGALLCAALLRRMRGTSGAPSDAHS